MDQLDQDDAPLGAQPRPDSGPPPEFLNPESPRYQPWAEKQISNATKEKRPLAEFLADFDARLAAIGQRETGSWDPQHNERLLAKFSPGGSAPARRRRRRRPGGRRPAQAEAARAPVGQPGAAGQPQAKAGMVGNSASRRRRRRRPHAGHRGPEGGSAT